MLDWQEVKEKYPKGWETLKWFIIEQNDRSGFKSITFGFKGLNIVLCNHYYKHEIEDKFNIIPFNMLYGLLEDFFEKNGIIIQIDYNIYNEHFQFSIGDIIGWRASKYDYGTRQEAKQQAILKACETLEKQLNNKT